MILADTRCGTKGFTAICLVNTLPLKREKDGKRTCSLCFVAE